MHESLEGGDRLKRVSRVAVVIRLDALASWAALVIALLAIGQILFDSPIAAAVAAAGTWSRDTVVVIGAVGAACAAAVMVSRLTTALWQSNLDRLDTLAEARATRERIRRKRDETPSDPAPAS